LACFLYKIRMDGWPRTITKGLLLGFEQLLDDELYRFRRYLVLQNQDTQLHRRLVVPQGRVVEREDGIVDITLSHDRNEDLEQQSSYSIVPLVLDDHVRFGNRSDGNEVQSHAMDMDDGW
jgi:hypothetical protein